VNLEGDKGKAAVGRGNFMAAVGRLHASKLKIPYRIKNYWKINKK